MLHPRLLRCGRRAASTLRRAPATRSCNSFTMSAQCCPSRKTTRLEAASWPRTVADPGDTLHVHEVPPSTSEVGYLTETLHRSPQDLVNIVKTIASLTNTSLQQQLLLSRQTSLGPPLLLILVDGLDLQAAGIEKDSQFDKMTGGRKLCKAGNAGHQSAFKGKSIITDDQKAASAALDQLIGLMRRDAMDNHQISILSNPPLNDTSAALMHLVNSIFEPTCQSWTDSEMLKRFLLAAARSLHLSPADISSTVHQLTNAVAQPNDGPILLACLSGLINFQNKWGKEPPVRAARQVQARLPRLHDMYHAWQISSTSDAIPWLGNAIVSAFIQLLAESDSRSPIQDRVLLRALHNNDWPTVNTKILATDIPLNQLSSAIRFITKKVLYHCDLGVHKRQRIIENLCVLLRNRMQMSDPTRKGVAEALGMACEGVVDALFRLGCVVSTGPLLLQMLRWSSSSMNRLWPDHFLARCIRTLGQHGEVEIAKVIFDSIPIKFRTLEHYKSRMSLFRQPSSQDFHERRQDILLLWRQLINQLEPDTSTCEIYMSLVARFGCFQEVENVIQLMTKQGCIEAEEIGMNFRYLATLSADPNTIESLESCANTPIRINALLSSIPKRHQQRLRILQRGGETLRESKTLAASIEFSNTLHRLRECHGESVLNEITRNLIVRSLLSSPQFFSTPLFDNDNVIDDVDEMRARQIWQLGLMSLQNYKSVALSIQQFIQFRQPLYQMLLSTTKQFTSSKSVLLQTNILNDLTLQKQRSSSYTFIIQRLEPPTRCKFGKQSNEFLYHSINQFVNQPCITLGTLGGNALPYLLQLDTFLKVKRNSSHVPHRKKLMETIQFIQLAIEKCQCQ